MTTQWVNRQTGETSEPETTFFQSDRSRTAGISGPRPVHGDGTLDMRPGPRLVSIARCDLGQAFELNLDDGEYAVSSYPRYKPTKEQIERMQARDSARDSIFEKVAPWVPTVRSETKTVDTGERKDFYGHVARHVVTTWKRTPLAGSHFEPQESVTDGWYIDLDTSLSCEVKWRRNVKPRHEYYAVGGERYEIIDDGIRDTGFAIEHGHISRGIGVLPDGSKRESADASEYKITEFYEGPLDPPCLRCRVPFAKLAI